MNLSRARLLAHHLREPLSAAQAMLKTLATVREADSATAWALGLLSLVGNALDVVVPNYPTAYLMNQGYRPVGSAELGQIVHRAFQAAGIEGRSFAFPAHQEVVVEYPFGMAVLGGLRHAGNLWCREGAAPARHVQDAFWKAGSAVELLDDASGGGGASIRDVNLQVQPLKRAGDYVAWPGGPNLDDVVARVEPGRPYAVLLVGVTGCGKSSFARHLAERVGRGQGRVMKITASAIRNMNTADVLQLVLWTRPDVLLLDDLQELFDRSQPATREAATLALLEALHDAGTVLVGTIMVDPERVHAAQRLERGTLHFRGLRPDRFDDVVLFPMPEAEGRRTILSHYLEREVNETVLQALVEASGGLTGAYLRRLAEVINAGREEPRQALQRLLAMAPPEQELGPVLPVSNKSDAVQVLR